MAFSFALKPKQDRRPFSKPVAFSTFLKKRAMTLAEGFAICQTFWLPDFWLPDFWLPDLNRWFEDKDHRPSLEELEKCRALAIETGNEVLLAFGSPDPDVEQK